MTSVQTSLTAALLTAFSERASSALDLAASTVWRSARTLTEEEFKVQYTAALNATQAAPKAPAKPRAKKSAAAAPAVEWAQPTGGAAQRGIADPPASNNVWPSSAAGPVPSWDQSKAAAPAVAAAKAWPTAAAPAAAQQGTQWKTAPPATAGWASAAWPTGAVPARGAPDQGAVASAWGAAQAPAQAQAQAPRPKASAGVAWDSLLGSSSVMETPKAGLYGSPETYPQGAQAPQGGETSA